LLGALPRTILKRAESKEFKLPTDANERNFSKKRPYPKLDEMREEKGYHPDN
jgi:hypothetical protein